MSQVPLVSELITLLNDVTPWPRTNPTNSPSAGGNSTPTGAKSTPANPAAGPKSAKLPLLTVPRLVPHPHHSSHSSAHPSAHSSHPAISQDMPIQAHSIVLPPLNRRLTDPIENYSADKRVSVSSSLGYSRNASVAHLDADLAATTANNNQSPVTQTNSQMMQNSEESKLPPIKQLRLHESPYPGLAPGPALAPAPGHSSSTAGHSRSNSATQLQSVPQLPATGTHSAPVSSGPVSSTGEPKSDGAQPDYFHPGPKESPAGPYYYGPMGPYQVPISAPPMYHPMGHPMNAGHPMSAGLSPPMSAGHPGQMNHMVPHISPGSHPGMPPHMSPGMASHMNPGYNSGMSPGAVAGPGMAGPAPGMPMGPFAPHYIPVWLEENHALIHKRRIIKRRTRTGCLTCRKRRIKCDERRPHCYNCERSRKVCLGYENLNKKKNSDNSDHLDEKSDSDHEKH